jgi:hypothetical protein
VVTGTGQWYEAGAPLVPALWVWVPDRTGTHRDAYFFTTDPSWTAAQVLGTYTGRWNIGTTFQEMRAYLGLETTRGWAEKTVLRVAPCLFGLYTVVAVRYVQRPARVGKQGRITGPGKQDVTFSDALTAVRRWLWVQGVFVIPGHNAAYVKLGHPFREMLLAGLAPAA